MVLFKLPVLVRYAANVTCASHVIGQWITGMMGLWEKEYAVAV